MKASEFVFLLYFAVMFGARAAGVYEGMAVYGFFLVAGALLFTIKLAMTRYSVAEILVIALLLAVGGLVYLKSGEKGPLLYFSLLIGMKGVSLERVERWALTLLLIFFPLLNLLTVTGLVKDVAYPAEGRLFFGAMMRRSMGYPYFNTMFTTFIILMALVMLCRGYRPAREILAVSLFLLVIAVYLYVYSGSNTGMIVTLLYLAVNYLLQLRPQVSRAGGILIRLLYPACLAFSILGPLLIEGETFALLDKLFHNRFAYPRYFLLHEPVTLFGVRFAPGPNENYYIDSSYLYSFLQIGVIPCILLTCLMMGMIRHLVRENRRIELAVVVSFCILGLSDPFFYNLSFKNLMFLFAGAWLWPLLGRLSKKLPAAFGKTVCLVPAGDRMLCMESSLPCRALRRVGAFLDSVFSQCAFLHVGGFILTLAVLTAGVLFFTAPGNIVGRVDIPAEWETVRTALSAGIWSGILVMIFLTGLTAHRAGKGDQL